MAEQTVQGRIYAPNLVESNLCEILKDQKAIRVEKLMKDPKKTMFLCI